MFVRLICDNKLECNVVFVMNFLLYFKMWWVDWFLKCWMSIINYELFL